MRKEVFIAYCLSMFLFLSAAAQEVMISGLVRDTSSVPLEGVTVSIVGKTGSVITDKNGAYRIAAAIGETISFSMLGSEPVRMVIRNGDPINVEMKTSVNALEDVIVTGYTSERKKDLTGAVSVVKIADIENVPLGNPVKAMQGRVPGVEVGATGAPNGGVTVRMRGQTTLNISNDPLYIIDGVPTQRGLQEINQSDIESMQVLRDASAASIYGSRAAAGVIIVTTKRGKSGVRRIDVDASHSLQFYNSKINTLNTDQRARAYWQAAVNDGRFGPALNNPQDPADLSLIYDFDWNRDFSNPQLNAVILGQYVDPEQTMLTSDTRWFDEVSRVSQIKQYNLALANGGQHGTSFFSLGYYDNEGIIKRTRSQRLTLRMNIDHSLFNGKLKIGENLNLSYFKDAQIPTGDITSLALILNPILPVRTLDGGWGGPVAGMDDRQNPVRLIEDNKQNNNHFGRILSSTFADLSILEGLNFRTAFNVDYAGTFYRHLLLPYQSGFLNSDVTQVNTNFDYSGSLTWQNILTYDLNSNEHRVNFLLGSETVNNQYQGFNASAQGLAIADMNYAYLTQGTRNILARGDGNSDALQSFFFKANYNYHDRYLASVTIRRDGSSKFGSNNRYANFPAASLGWRISEESFFKDHIGFISDFKLRYSWGQTGNQSIPAYATYSLYRAIYGTDLTWDPSEGSAYDIGGQGTGTLPSGYTAIQTGNPDLKWETTTQSNFGVDFGLLSNKLTGSVEYYIKNTEDILISPPYLGVVGEGGNTWINGASLENKGLEAAVNYTQSLGPDLRLDIAANITRNRLKITELPNNAIIGYPGNGTTYTIIGHSPNTHFGWVADGLFTTQEQLDNSPEQPGKALGRIRYLDLDQNGRIDNNDQQYLGTSDPDFTYGLNLALSYKRFNIALFFQGIQGGVVNNSYKNLTDFTSLAPGSNWGSRVLEGWTPENPTATVPALTLVNTNNENRFSTYFLEPRSYLKLRNIEIGYDLKDAFERFNVSRARVYMQASNLLRLKNEAYTAPDPENPGNAYPIPVIATLGFNLSF
ncbi:TonB-dependent receptor [Olivibacter sp. XZL3]|uniref:SusC/RagA family TonB-linked outer membrane protein n=1 Tax=Olivibacter sp. XZL3 TaxID=1735116 RepID=UPI001066C260|nr:TonB-dependent receptor [Olivibacter sp. XZL3]